jgi:hypothetical protein
MLHVVSIGVESNIEERTLNPASLAAGPFVREFLSAFPILRHVLIQLARQPITQLAAQKFACD